MLLITIPCFLLECLIPDTFLLYPILKTLIIILISATVFILIDRLKKVLNYVMFLLSLLFSAFLFYELELMTQFYKKALLSEHKILFMFCFISYHKGAFELPWHLKSIEILASFLYLFLKYETIDLDGSFFIFFAFIWFSIANLYLREKNSRESFYELMGATSLVDKYRYLLKEVDPGVNILLKQSKDKTSKKQRKFFNVKEKNKKNLKFDEKFTYEIEYINSWAQEKYSLDSLAKVMEFFDQIHFKEGLDPRKNGTNAAKTIKNYLENINNPFGSRNSFDFSPAKRYFCYKKDILNNNTKDLLKGSSNEFQFSAIFCVYEWKSDMYVLIRLNHLDEEVEELRELDRFKEQLLANITHDLRTPLNGMIYFIRQAKENNKQDEQELKKLLNYAEINGNLLMNLIGDILDRSLLKANKMRLNIQKFALKGVMDEIMILLQSKAEFQSIKLLLLFLCNDEIIVESDSDRLKQVLINLVGNAIKFTKKGFVKLRVSKKNEQFISFEVIDSGIGICQEDIQRLGTAFNSFDTHGMNCKGIGLGLSISKEIIGKLGPKNQLYISSKLGLGTKFAFRIYRSLLLKEKVGVQKVKTLIKPLSRNKEFTFEKLTLKKQQFAETNDIDIIENFEHLANFGNVKNVNIVGNLVNNVNIIEIFTKNFEKEEEFSEVDSTEFQKESEISMNFCSEGIDEKMKNNEKNNELSPLSVKTLFERRSKKKTMLQLINGNVEKNELRRNQTPQKKLVNFLLEKLNPLKILIVDDNCFNILIMEKFLKRLTNNQDNPQIINEFAHNGEIAVEKFKKNNEIHAITPFNVIIMDCEMPIMNGFDASMAIAKLIRDENFKKCEIIAYSALNLDFEVDKCKEHGMMYFLCKPCNENQFFTVLYQCLRTKEDDEESKEMQKDE